MARVRINLRVDEELWASVRALAERERRTVTSYVEEALEGLLGSGPLPQASAAVREAVDAGGLGAGAAVAAEEAVEPSPSRMYRCRCPKDWGDSVMCPDCGYRAR
jgi:hypothetical protein